MWESNFTSRQRALGSSVENAQHVLCLRPEQGGCARARGSTEGDGGASLADEVIDDSIDPAPRARVGLSFRFLMAPTPQAIWVRATCSKMTWSYLMGSLSPPFRLPGGRSGHSPTLKLRSLREPRSSSRAGPSCRTPGSRNVGAGAHHTDPKGRRAVMSLAGNAEIKSLFGSAVFDHPKPTSLLKYLIRSVTSEDQDALVVDFFAGSSSTAHAVLALNAEDGGRRRFLMSSCRSRLQKAQPLVLRGSRPSRSSRGGASSSLARL